MALINCPHCSKRVSSLARVCSHCDRPIAEVSEEEIERLAIKRWKDRSYRALNISYLGLTLAVAGALWWWISGEPGWDWPAPQHILLTAALGVVIYIAGRSWVWWLRFNKPGKKLGSRR